MSAPLPPIASPHGQDTFPFSRRPDENCVRLPVNLRLISILRYCLAEWLAPFNLGALLLFPCVASLVAFTVASRFLGLAALPLVFVISLLLLFIFSAPIALCIRLCSKRRFEIWISDIGLFKRYPKRDIFFPWHKFIWIIERKGDLWLATFIDGCFIPRESFASPEEAREFTAIVREIKRTRGSVWRDKWNGRVFGVQSSSEEPGALSIPR